MDIKQLDELFRIYGYEVKEHKSSYAVYVLNQGMYHGAEVIVFDNSDVESVLAQYSKLGYHAKKQEFKTIEEAELYLFSGFFNIKTTEFDITRRYSEYAANQVKHYCNPNINYKYISMPYSICCEQTNDSVRGNTDIISAIKNEINRKGARLIIVEAAAGFGKTCTAYEVYKSFIEKTDYQKPIFTELSRNRDAKQFKYILWSEIDKEKETTAKQDLVIYNIKKGRIPLIIDGFDELLSKDIDSGKAEQLNEFEQVETMLSTIGDLLTGESKVVLTSRRTAIFAGAEFESWVDSYNGCFDIVRFQLDKPDIKEWLSNERYNEITRHNIPFDSISNPVLLTYLRNINSEEFEELMNFPETLTESFFKFLLEREKIRQNINIRWEDQMVIYQNLTKAFADFDIMGESRDFVKELIIEYNKEDLTYYKESMTTKQTLDELADTLTNHALLDRIGNKDFITFVNEFVFGYLFGKGIIDAGIEYLSKLNPFPDYLLELAVSSFKYSSDTDKQKLWGILAVIKDSMSLSLALSTDCVLKGKILSNYEYEGINSYFFDKVIFSGSDCRFADVSFVDDTFSNCKFDPRAFSNATFTGCRFIDCEVINTGGGIEPQQIHCYGCDDYNSGFITSFEADIVRINDSTEDVKLELQILSKYFKVDGKSPKMRHVSAIRKDFESFDLDTVFSMFYLLKKKGFLLVDGNNSYITRKGISYFHKTIQ